MKLSAHLTGPMSRCGRRRGVALVITLIMLAIVTVFAVAFLSVARRERVSVAVKQDIDDARLANDAAQARAQAEIIGRMIGNTNLYDYDLLVSYNQDGANIYNGGAFTDTLIGQLTNDARVPVFVPRPAGGLDFRFFLDLNRNAFYDTNFLGFTPNGTVQFTTVGDPEWVGIMERAGEVHSRSNRFLMRYAYIALPVSKSLDVNFVGNNAGGGTLSSGLPTPRGFRRNHGYGNWEFNLAAFLHELNPSLNGWLASAYSYVPSGNNGGPGFVSANDILRYRYATNDTPQFSFVDLYPGIPVHAIDRPALFASDGIDGYADGPFVGGAGLNFDASAPPPGNDDPVARWPGSLGRREIRSFEELVDANLSARYPNFQFALTNIMRAVNSPFDRETFYRMLAQMGTDSVGSEPVRIVGGGNVSTNADFTSTITNLVGHGYNPGDWVRVSRLNVSNVIHTYRVVRTWDDAFVLDASSLVGAGPFLLQKNNKIHLNCNNLTEQETNFIPWTASQFFTNTADRLLRQWTNYGIGLSLTNIPVYPTNYYTPRVHQLLQLAVNIYDASATNQFPSIFRPHFTKTAGGEVYVSGYAPVVGTNILNPVSNPRIGLSRFATNTTIVAGNYTNLVMFGIPPVVGAKKHLPNFNEFAMSTAMQAVRRLQVIRPATNQPPNETNQMFLLSLTNSFAAEVWHPYNRIYPNTVGTYIELTSEATLTNELGFYLQTNFPFIANQTFAPPVLGPYLFTLVITNTVAPVLPLSAYFTGTPPYAGFIAPNTFVPLTNLIGSSNLAGSITNIPFEKGVPLYEPQWIYSVTNRLFYAMVDAVHEQIIDLVALEGLSMRQNLNDVLAGRVGSNNIPNVQVGAGTARGSLQDFWQTGVYGTPGPTPGMLRQIAVSRSSLLFPGWNDFNVVKVQDNAATNFNRLLTAARVRAGETNFQAPFTPGETLWLTYKWQVDDPLVHYVADNYTSDKDSGLNPALDRPELFRPPVPLVFSSLGTVNQRYRPWGGYRVPTSVSLGLANFANDDEFAFLPNAKDPLVRVPDEWDFPTVFEFQTNKYGNLGWIGRVHRGTPWQSVYLKSAAINTNDWMRFKNTLDTYPTNDWSLVDLFTTHVDDHARRGLVSVNQTNRAAWAAALAAMPVLITNASSFDGSLATVPPPMVDRFIAPGSPEFDAIFNGIQAWRIAQPQGVFTNLGSFLGAMDLSVGNNTNSPFLPPDAPPLNPAGFQTGWQNYPLTDVAAERIPQQLLSMVQLESPVRFAVYAWGQSLRPADRSLVTVPGPTFQLCTNYQITGEVLTKSIIRIEPRVITDPFPGAFPTNNVTNLNIVVESYEVLQNP